MKAGIPVLTALAPLCLSVATEVASGEETCSVLTTLADKVQAAQMVDIADPFGSVSPSERFCGVTRGMSGTMGYYCAWEYPYRSKEADGQFEHLAGTLEVCFEGRGSLNADQPVNHPDYYDLRKLQLENVEVAVSIKDKGALQATYVFVRVSRTGAE